MTLKEAQRAYPELMRMLVAEYYEAYDKFPIEVEFWVSSYRERTWSHAYLEEAERGFSKIEIGPADYVTVRGQLVKVENLPHAKKILKQFIQDVGLKERPNVK
jgi:hypothetical protein